MVLMLMLLTSVNAQFKPTSPTFGSDIPIFNYYDCTFASSHVYVANNGWIYVLARVEASASSYQAWRVFYSTDDGVTFIQLNQWEYNTDDYVLQDCDFVITGENSSDIRLWIAEATNSGNVTPHNAYVRVNEYDAYGNYIAQAYYLDYLAAPNNLVSVSIATDYRSPGGGMAPFGIGVAFTGNWNGNSWYSYAYSLDGGATFTAKSPFSQTGTGQLGRISVSLGATYTNAWGRMAVAFEMNKVGDLGDIGVMSNYTDLVGGSWTTPVAVNQTFGPSTGLCRYPAIQIMDNVTTDPTIADYVPILIAYEDWSSGVSAKDIMYNTLNASYVDLSQPTIADFYYAWIGAGNGHSETEPNLSFDKGYNNFLLTYATDNNNQLKYRVCNMNDIGGGTWADLGNYRDLNTPMTWPVQPKVDINPTNLRACFTWAEMTTFGIYNILFDAEWSTVGIGEHQGQPSDNSFALSPNPAKDFVKISISKPGDYTVTMTSILGQEVINTTVHGSEYTLPLGEITQGIYMVRITGNGIDTIKKLVVN
jgi:hypothetical protein